MRATPALLLTLLCAATLAAACRSTDGRDRTEVVFDQPLVALDEAGRSEALEALQPADVFVAPVGDQSEAFAPPTADLRRALVAGLVDRLYSPLSLDWCEAQLASLAADGPVAVEEAAALLRADAFLEVRLLAWDESELETEGRVTARLEARLVDPAAPDAPLWAYRIGRVVEVGEAVARRSTREVLVERVAEDLARELLALLPARDARLAPR